MKLAALTEDPRAHRLLEQFDLRYERFAAELPASLRTLAGNAGTFQGRHSDEPFKASTSTNPIYTCTPWLFWEQFCDLPEETFLDLAFAGGLVSLASVLMDHLIDEQAEEPELVAALRKTLLQHGVGLLHGYHPWKDPFWAHFKRLHREHLRSLAIESSLQAHPVPLFHADLKAMAGGKVSPVVITIAALAIAAGCEQIIEPIERSLKVTFIAGQLHDDVLDWVPDLEAHHLTYFLTHFMVSDEEGSYLPLVGEEIMARMETDWLDVTHLEQAMTGYQEAIAAVSGLACCAWVAQLEEYHATGEEHRRMLLERHVLRQLSEISEGDLREAFGDSEKG